MAWVFRSGQTEPSMKATGRTTRPTVMESFGMLMGIYVIYFDRLKMREIGLMIKLMAKVLTLT